MKDDIDLLKKKIVPILNKYPIKKAGIFGSVISEKTLSEAGDIDILFEKSKELTYKQYSDLINELILALGKEVDLVQYDLIKPALREYILPNEIRIYEANK